MLEAGRPAPEFSLKDLRGERRRLGDFLKRGRVLVVFFKISCPTCHLTLPFLERLKDRLQVVGISQDESADTGELMRHFGLTFPVLIDPAKDRYMVSNAYRITNVPSLFLLEASGKIAWADHGFYRAGLTEWLGPDLFRETDVTPAMKPG